MILKYDLELFLLTVLSRNPHKFNITISTEEYDAETDSNGLSCQLVFTYTGKYPDTAPEVEIENSVNFEDDYEDKLLEHIKETVIIDYTPVFFVLCKRRIIEKNKLIKNDFLHRLTKT